MYQRRRMMENAASLFLNKVSVKMITTFLIKIQDLKIQVLLSLIKQRFVSHWCYIQNKHRHKHGIES